MIKRPLNTRFAPKVLAGIKRTTQTVQKHLMVFRLPATH